MDRETAERFVHTGLIESLRLVLRICKRLNLRFDRLVDEAQQLEQLSHDEEDE